MTSFSHAGLVEQLSSEYGDQFTVEQAEYGVSQAGLSPLPQSSAGGPPRFGDVRLPNSEA